MSEEVDGAKEDDVSEQPPADDGNAHVDGPTDEPRGLSMGQKVGRVLLGVLVVLFGVFAVANAHPVDFSWILGETLVEIDEAGQRIEGGVPLIVLLVVAFAIGLVSGLFFAWQRRRRRLGGAG